MAPGHHHHHGHGFGSAALIGAAAVGMAVGAASAHHHHHGHHDHGHHHHDGYYAPSQTTEVVVVGGAPPPQVVYAPPPAYVSAPSPVYVSAPSPVYVSAPPPVYVSAPPVVVAPPPVYMPSPQPQVIVSSSPGYGYPQATVTVYSAPTRAYSLGKKWKHGNIVTFTNMTTRQTMRINEYGGIDAHGEFHHHSQFQIEHVSQDRVLLRNMAFPGSHLRIATPQSLDHGPGGPYCEFYVVKHGKGSGRSVYSLESVMHPGSYVGFHESGHPKPPYEVGLGHHGSFHVDVIQWAAW